MRPAKRSDARTRMREQPGRRACTVNGHGVAGRPRRASARLVLVHALMPRVIAQVNECNRRNRQNRCNQQNRRNRRNRASRRRTGGLLRERFVPVNGHAHLRSVPRFVAAAAVDVVFDDAVHVPRLILLLCMCKLPPFRAFTDSCLFCCSASQGGCFLAHIDFGTPVTKRWGAVTQRVAKQNVERELVFVDVEVGQRAMALGADVRRRVAVCVRGKRLLTSPSTPTSGGTRTTHNPRPRATIGIHKARPRLGCPGAGSRVRL